MDFYKSIVRPLLFCFPPEKASALGHWALRRKFIWQGFSPYFKVEDDRLNVDLGGIRLPNPVGLSGGFDKDCELVESMMHLGFGYVTVGSILRDPHKGNPHPRLLRYADTYSLVHCLGLPSKGLEYSLSKLKKIKQRLVPVIASLACRSSSRYLTIEEYVECYKRLEPFVDAIELGLSCPNLREGRAGKYEDISLFAELVGEICKIKNKPFFVKMGAREYHSELISICQKNNVNGVTISPRKMINDPRLSMGVGTLSGKGTFSDMLRTISEIYQATKGEIPIKISGGIFTGSDAFEVIARGATAVELYAGLVYEGWSVAKQINTELLGLLKRNDFKSINEARGTKH